MRMELIQIFGDTLNFIKWFNRQQIFQNYILIPLLEEILYLKQHFDHIIVCHINRQRNTQAGFLSKEGLQHAMGSWHITEVEEDRIHVSDQQPFNS